METADDDCSACSDAVHNMTGTLLMAVLALIISTASLSWQIVLYLLGASRPVVQLQAGGLVEDEAIIMPIGAADSDQLKRHGFGIPVVAVTIQNRGRLAVSVTSWSIAFDNGAKFLPPKWYPNDQSPLPHRLDPGAEVTFLCELRRIEVAGAGMRDATKPPKYCRGSATFGTGKTVYSHTKLTFTPAR